MPDWELGPGEGKERFHRAKLKEQIPDQPAKSHTQQAQTNLTKIQSKELHKISLTIKWDDLPNSFSELLYTEWK